MVVTKAILSMIKSLRRVAEVPPIRFVTRTSVSTFFFSHIYILLTSEDADQDDAAPKHDVEVKTIVFDNDLKDWLDFTGYGDAEFRTGYLDYHRTLRIVSEQKAAIEIKEAKLRQSQHKYGYTRSNNPSQTARSTIDTAPATKESFTGNYVAPSASGDLHDNNYDRHHNVPTQHRTVYNEEQQNTPREPLPDSSFARNESGNGTVDLGRIDSNQGEWRAPTPDLTRQMTPVTKPNNDDGAYNRRSGSPATPVHKQAWPRTKHSVKQANTVFTERREYRNDRGELFRSIDLGSQGGTP